MPRLAPPVPGPLKAAGVAALLSPPPTRGDCCHQLELRKRWRSQATEAQLGGTKAGAVRALPLNTAQHSPLGFAPRPTQAGCCQRL